MTVKLDYGIGNGDTIESCVTFENCEEAREFAHKALDEILKEVQAGVRADNGLIHIWDDESNKDLINNLWGEEY